LREYLWLYLLIGVIKHVLVTKLINILTIKNNLLYFSYFIFMRCYLFDVL